MSRMPLRLLRITRAVAGAVAMMSIATGAQAQSDTITAPPVQVIDILPPNLVGVPGSASVVTQEDIARAQPPSVTEVMRTVPGVHVVEEGALGLNLNIGIRGLDPRRSSRTLLLEDGMPIHLGPYSDPSAHYHPPTERVQSVEVLKGSGQIIHGPQTVGGVINFITRQPPSDREARLRIAGGEEGFGSLFARYGNGDQDKGFAIDFTHKQVDGVREKYEAQATDLTVSGRIRISDSQRLLAKFGRYEEDSKTGEWGQTQARFDANPRGNPFDNDVFVLDRNAGQLIHELDIADNLLLSTRMYYTRSFRASYRQIDDSTDNMTAGPPGSGCTTGPQRADYENSANCGNKMRPRTYTFWGIEPRLDWNYNAFGAENHLVTGVRLHQEDVVRKRYNGLFADAREDTPGTRLRDQFEIETTAWSAFLQNTFNYGAFGITPGVRVERIESTNTWPIENFVPNGGSISNTNTEVLPGLGLTYQVAAATTLFGGAHKGFAPPRPDANLYPGDPNLVPVKPETSTNYEIGVRSVPRPGLSYEATVFRTEFEDQIVPGGSVGLTQTWANAGETLHQGIELGWRVDFGVLSGSNNGNPYFTGAYTYLADAEFTSNQLNGTTNVNGNRLPYAPENLLSASLGYEFPWGLDVRVGVNYIDDQYADNLNTVAGSADGQEGLVPSVTLYNFSVNYALKKDKLNLFVAGTNLTDETYIVSRVDGIQVSRARLIYAGLDWRF